MAKDEQNGNGDYEVGYGKPPKATQFKPGRSGNPQGRPKGSRNVATAFHSAFSEKITVNVGGKKQQISKLDAAFKQLANKAAAGDSLAIRMTLQNMPLFETMINNTPSTTKTSEQERKVLQTLLDRMQAPDTLVIDAEFTLLNEDNKNE